MLEDDASDIIQKAARGLGVETPPHRSDDQITAAAAALGLDPRRLLAIAHHRYQPTVLPPDGLAVFTTRYGRLQMDVNAYLAFDRASGTAVAFDTGADARPALGFVRDHQLELAALFITHTHPDHIADLGRFGDTPVHAPAAEPLDAATAVRPGDSFRFGPLTVEARLTSGHSPGGTSYVVHGLAAPVAIVGDALFAGSIGGPKVSYRDARDHIRSQIFTLPPDTVLCPGHGPLTSVALETENNPFFPER
jgi:glyoxylase-like metal-dependent hydrolase (beta-lactamase superfamily II)